MRFIPVGLLWLLSALAADPFMGRVVHVADGDTLTVEANDRQVRVRLYGVDAPEKDQDGGEQAAWFMTSAALDRAVQVNVHDTDRYGRIVANVVLADGRVLNQELLRAGHAWWYVQYAAGDQDLETLQADARAQRRGLWAASDPLPPWEWRKAGRGVSHNAKRRSARRSERRDYR